MSKPLQLIVGALLVLVGASSIEASTASLTTPESSASFEVQVITADDM